MVVNQNQKQLLARLRWAKNKGIGLGNLGDLIVAVDGLIYLIEKSTDPNTQLLGRLRQVKNKGIGLGNIDDLVVVMDGLIHLVEKTP